MQMFLENAGGVLNRHFITGEWNQPGPLLNMQGVQRRSFEWRTAIHVILLAHAQAPQLTGAQMRESVSPLCRET